MEAGVLGSAYTTAVGENAATIVGKYFALPALETLVKVAVTAAADTVLTEGVTAIPEPGVDAVVADWEKEVNTDTQVWAGYSTGPNSLPVPTDLPIWGDNVSTVETYTAHAVASNSVIGTTTLNTATGLVTLTDATGHTLTFFNPINIYTDFASAGGISLDLPDVNVLVGAGTTLYAGSNNFTATLGANVTLTLSVGTADVLSGVAGDTLVFDANTSATVSGTGITVNLYGDSSLVTLATAGNVVNDFAPAASVGGADTTIYLDGSAGQTLTGLTGAEQIIDFNTLATVSASGGTLTSYAGAAGAQTLSFSGSYEVLFESPGEVTDFGSGTANYTILSSNNTINLGVGAGSTFVGTGTTVGLDGTGASAAFATPNNTDVVDDYAFSVAVTGASLVQLTTSNQILLATSVPTINDFGTNNYVTANSATIDSIPSAGNKQTLFVYGLGNTLLTSPGETIHFGDSASAEVEGPTVTLYLGTGDAIGLADAGNLINDLGTSAAISGGGQTIGLDLAGNQTLATGTGAETIIDYGSNNVLAADNSSISMMSKAAELTLIGSDNTASAMANQTISLNAGTSNTFGVTTGDTVVLGASTSATLTGGSATISAAAGSQATLDGLSYSYVDGTGAAGTGVVTGASSGGLIASSPGLTVNLGAGSHWTLNGGSAAVNAAAASQVTLNGGGYAYADPTGAAGTGVTAGAASSGVIASSPGLTANVGANAIWTFNGGSAVVNAAPQSQVTLQNGGGYDYADGGGAAGTGVVAGRSSTGIINGSVGLTAKIGASASYILNGGAFTINASAGSYTDLNTGSGYDRREQLRHRASGGCCGERWREWHHAGRRKYGFKRHRPKQ